MLLHAMPQCSIPGLLSAAVECHDALQPRLVHRSLVSLALPCHAIYPHRPGASLRSRRIFPRRGLWSFNFTARKSRSSVESKWYEKLSHRSKTVEESALWSMPGPNCGFGKHGTAGFGGALV